MSKRESGLESIKILAIFIIIVSHVAQTMINEPIYLLSLSDSLLVTQVATESINRFILVFFTYFGYLGVDIFVAASSWYLCENDKIHINKVLKMILDVFMISVIFLCGFLISGYKLPITLIVKSLMPSFFYNNWFISCYILFYVMHPFFNIVIKNVTKIQHRNLCILLIFLYVICNIFFIGKFYSNEFVDFIVIYFCVAYIKEISHGGDLLASRTKLLGVAIIATAMLLTLLGITNLIGLKIGCLSTWIFKWRTMHNPLTLVIAISLVLAGKSFTFINQRINYVSFLTLYIYIIHENILFRNFARVKMVAELLNLYGKNNSVLICILFSLFLFVSSIILAWLYKKILDRPISRVVESIESKVCF